MISHDAHDTFDLRATIAKIEKHRSRITYVYFALFIPISVFLLESHTFGERLAFGSLFALGVLIHREIIECRLDVVRSSLRDILTKRDPSLLTDPDW